MEQNNLQEIGKRFKDLRVAKGWSQATCARKLGYSNKTSISKIELGVQGIRRSQIEHVCEVLETTPAFLMGWTDSPDETMPTTPNKQALIDKVLTLSDDQCKRISDLLDALIANKQ